MKIKKIISLGLFGLSSILFFACSNGDKTENLDTITVPVKPAYVIPDTLSLTEVTVKKTGPEECDGGGCADARFDIHIIANGSSYTVTVYKQGYAQAGNTAEYKDLDNVFKDAKKLHDSILNRNVKDFIVIFDDNGFLKSLIYKGKTTGEVGKVGTYDPEIVIWEKK